MRESSASRQIPFDSTPEIFATEGDGSFSFDLAHDKDPWIETGSFDEVRIVLSLWHPSARRSIDLDRAYVEILGRFDTDEEHWIRVAEVEPIVPAYEAGKSFDGWIVLPVFGARSAYRLAGAGLESRARLQIRASAYFVT